ncbi:TIGR04282 family arsenosugar biosynthesis glycosyltransferase [Olleya marilimosa]|uniref:DUF2064 domain-containing protein n=1 Tax=Olleya marilimosa TaxID=272164 RepID=A0ABR8LXC9_9FLAO|nr:DUF2064 domain-containing protein [Olleya marilimosa]MBD3864048.1 DUF2064 domain-containing protein [Olleya marilimosa]MBD3891610.1 DUF2064 domain-containing protein [Olleya marilimosa]
MKTKTAILIFSNSAKEDAKRKSFSDSQLFETLTNDTIRKVKKTGLPFFHFTEAQQQGSNFGDRFTNAIQLVFDKGFTNVISIGNDTPHLKTKHINDAYQKLNNNQLVFGPSKDGGFYLMGLTKNLFNVKQFKNLPWQTSALKSTTLQCLSTTKITFSTLETLDDIDSFKDLKSILNSYKTVSKTLKTVILQLCISAKAILKLIVLQYLILPQQLPFNKGSPTLVTVKN